MKKLISGIIVAAMMLSMTAVFAVTESGGESPITLEGKVTRTATLVSVQMPTRINFQINVNNQSDKKYTGISSGLGEVKNNLSGAPAYVYLSEVNEPSGSIGLLDMSSELELRMRGITGGSTKDVPMTATGGTPLVAGEPTQLLALGAAATGTLEVTAFKKSLGDVTFGDDQIEKTFTITAVMKVFAMEQPVVVP